MGEVKLTCKKLQYQLEEILSGPSREIVKCNGEQAKRQEA
jgi:hypothetical protein